nr:2-hydroxyglutaryl-CoA dehydratase [Desulfobacterales bacterium]
MNSKETLYSAGLDIGSALSKAVIMKNRTVLSSSVRPTEGNFSHAANTVLNDALEKAGLSHSDLASIGACGLGASFLAYPFTKITEISCHSRGVNYFFPSVRTVIEVGNQASRVINVTKEGKVADCIVSDRCAAGSSRILQIIAKVLKVDLKDMGPLSLKSTNPVRFTTGCAVFAETEAISRVAEGMRKEDIIAGLHQALAARISAMAQRIKLKEECAITGGGAKDIGLVRAVEGKIEKKLLVSDDPFITGAIGAALIAVEK